MVRFCEKLIGEPQTPAGAWGLARAMLQLHFGEALSAELAAVAAARGLAGGGSGGGGGGGSNGGGCGGSARPVCIDLEDEGGEEAGSANQAGQPQQPRQHGASATRAPQPTVDLTADARTLILLLRALASSGGSGSKRLTLSQLEGVWKGTGRKAEFNMGAIARADPALSKAERERRIVTLVLEEVLQLDYSFTAYAVNVYIACGRRADAVLGGSDAVVVALPAAYGEQGTSLGAGALPAARRPKAASKARRSAHGGEGDSASEAHDDNDDDFEDGGDARTMAIAKPKKSSKQKTER